MQSKQDIDDSGSVSDLESLERPESDAESTSNHSVEDKPTVYKEFGDWEGDSVEDGEDSNLQELEGAIAASDAGSNHSLSSADTAELLRRAQLDDSDSDISEGELVPSTQEPPVHDGNISLKEATSISSPQVTSPLNSFRVLQERQYSHRSSNQSLGASEADLMLTPYIAPVAPSNISLPQVPLLAIDATRTDTTTESKDSLVDLTPPLSPSAHSQDVTSDHNTTVASTVYDDDFDSAPSSARGGGVGNPTLLQEIIQRRRLGSISTADGGALTNRSYLLREVGTPRYDSDFESPIHSPKRIIGTPTLGPATPPDSPSLRSVRLAQAPRLASVNSSIQSSIDEEIASEIGDQSAMQYGSGEDVSDAGVSSSVESVDQAPPISLEEASLRSIQDSSLQHSLVDDSSVVSPTKGRLADYSLNESSIAELYPEDFSQVSSQLLDNTSRLDDTDRISDDGTLTPRDTSRVSSEHIAVFGLQSPLSSAAEISQNVYEPDWETGGDVSTARSRISRSSIHTADTSIRSVYSSIADETEGQILTHRTSAYSSDFESENSSIAFELDTDDRARLLNESQAHISVTEQQQQQQQSVLYESDFELEDGSTIVDNVLNVTGREEYEPDFEKSPSQERIGIAEQIITDEDGNKIPMAEYFARKAQVVQENERIRTNPVLAMAKERRLPEKSEVYSDLLARLRGKENKPLPPKQTTVQILNNAPSRMRAPTILLQRVQMNNHIRTIQKQAEDVSNRPRAFTATVEQQRTVFQKTYIQSRLDRIRHRLSKKLSEEEVRQLRDPIYQMADAMRQTPRIPSPSEFLPTDLDLDAGLDRLLLERRMRDIGADIDLGDMPVLQETASEGSTSWAVQYLQEWRSKGGADKLLSEYKEIIPPSPVSSPSASISVPSFSEPRSDVPDIRRRDYLFSTDVTSSPIGDMMSTPQADVLHEVVTEQSVRDRLLTLMKHSKALRELATSIIPSSPSSSSS